MQISHYNLDNFEEVVISLTMESLPILISRMALLKEQISPHLRFTSEGKRYNISLDESIGKYSQYKTDGREFRLRFSENAFEYTYYFLLNLLHNGYASVNHIHVDFTNFDRSELTLTILIADNDLVKWEHDIVPE